MARGKHKEDILRLRAEGKSYREIVKILDCPRSLVSYHCGEGQKEKNQNRQIKRRSLVHPFDKKLERFKGRSFKKSNELKNNRTAEQKLYHKVYHFHDNRITKEHDAMSFTVQDVITKFGENPKCYLTGDYISLYEPDTYHFDHIIPASKGGTNTLDNLGICTKEAKMSKTDHTLEEFIELCKKVIKLHGNN